MSYDIHALRPSWVRKINVAKVQDLVDGDCWLWTGANVNGYGRVFVGGRKGSQVSLHRYVYELLAGPIPTGLHIDHLCRQPACCNPQHLEPVLPITNARRGIRASQTHCKNNHPLSGSNLYLFFDSRRRAHRVCRACRDAKVAAWKTARKERQRQTWAKYGVAS
jgi:hypothetical protein